MLYPIGSVTAGLIGAVVAAPAMADGGALSSSLGKVIGVGAERGAALMMLGAAVGLAALVIPVTTNRALRSLDCSEN